MERYLCDTCLYANNCQFIAKHKEGAIGCSAYINTFGVSIDRLREICEAERDGRLVLMPCKVKRVPEPKIDMWRMSVNEMLCAEDKMEETK